MDIPEDVPFTLESPPTGLPDLPPGYVWGLKIIAEAEVVKASAEQEG